MKTLLDIGAIVDARNDDGGTPLHVASQGKGTRRVIGLLIGKGAAFIALLDHGAVVNVTTKKGASPLSMAVYPGNERFVKELLITILSRCAGRCLPATFRRKWYTKSEWPWIFRYL